MFRCSWSLGHTWDKTLTWTHCVEYILQQFSYASPVCKDAPMVCMKTTWICCRVCWNVIWSTPPGFKACLWTCAGEILCTTHLGSDISSHRFWLLKGRVLARLSVRCWEKAQMSSRWMFSCKSKAPSVPISACTEVIKIPDTCTYQMPADKEHFHLLQKSVAWGLFLQSAEQWQVIQYTP